MRKKLTAIGNSYGLVIDRPILELLKITPETEVELSTDGTRLIVEPVGVGESRRRPRLPATPDPRPRRGAPSAGKRPRYGFPRKEPW